MADIATGAVVEAVPGTLVEAHSYSGGLRHTAFGEGAGRPAWAPPADSVGWRDDFEIGAGDVVIDYTQRSFEGRTIAWVAVYRRSTDARFGDRSNHAGLGVWLDGLRLCDARALLTPLDQLAARLAASAEPEAIAADVAQFAAPRFLGGCLLAADALPPDWRGAPASSATLVDTQYLFARGSGLEEAIADVAEAVTRLSIGWKPDEATPRTIILVGARAEPPAERAFEALPRAGALVADLLEQMPDAFAKQRATAHDAQAAFEREQAAWTAECAAERQRIATERAESQSLDGQPATLGGVAARLNALSRQMAGIDEGLTRIGQAQAQAQAEAARRAPAPAQPPRRAPAPVAPREPAYEQPGGGDATSLILLIGISGFLAIAVVLGVLYWLGYIG